MLNYVSALLNQRSTNVYELHEIEIDESSQLLTSNIVVLWLKKGA